MPHKAVHIDFQVWSSSLPGLTIDTYEKVNTRGLLPPERRRDDKFCRFEWEYNRKVSYSSVPPGRILERVRRGQARCGGSASPNYLIRVTDLRFINIGLVRFINDPVYLSINVLPRPR